MERGLGKLAFSVVEILVVAQTLDFYMNSNRQSVQFLIFSLKYEDQRGYPQATATRTCAATPGGFSRQPAKVLMVVARKNMSVPIHRIVREIDPQKPSYPKLGFECVWRELVLNK